MVILQSNRFLTLWEFFVGCGVAHLIDSPPLRCFGLSAVAVASGILANLSASVSFHPQLGSFTPSLLGAAVYLVVTASFGFGALAPARIRLFTPRRAVGVAGLLLVGCALFLLRAHAEAAAGLAAGVAAVATAVAAMAALGAAASLALGSAFRSGRSAGSWALAAGAFGVPAGLFAANLSLSPIGANAALASLGALLVAVAAGRGILVLGVLILAGPWLKDGDAALERLRSAPRYGMHVVDVDNLSRADYSLVDRAWGQSGLVELFIGPNGPIIFANRFRISSGKGKEKAFWARWKKEERLLVIGAAGGVHSRDRCPGCRMTLVDINDATIAIFARHPEANGNAYLHSDVVASDGRNVLESRPPGSFDTVYFEFADSGRMRVGGVVQNFSLDTEEAVDALDRVLAHDGQVVFATSWAHLTLPFASALRRRGWDVDVGVKRYILTRTNVGTTVTGTAVFMAVAAKPGAVRRVGINPGWQILAPVHYRMPTRTDGGRWDLRKSMSRDQRAFRLGVFVSVILGATFLGILLTSSKEGAGSAAYFVCWGALHALLTPAAFYCLRFRLGEHLWSGWIVACAMGVAAGFGALAFGWTSRRRGVLAMSCAAAVVGIVFAAGPALRMAGPWAVILGFLPAAIMAGFAFPYGLEKFPATGLAVALAADALGAFLGLMLSIPLNWFFGRAALPWCCGVLLLAVVSIPWWKELPRRLSAHTDQKY